MVSRPQGNLAGDKAPLSESQVEQAAARRCKLAALAMQKRSQLLELMDCQVSARLAHPPPTPNAHPNPGACGKLQVRVEQQLALLGEELESCQSPGHPAGSHLGIEAAAASPEPPRAGSAGSVHSPGSRYNERHEAIGQDCERLLACHEQLRSYLEVPG